MKRQAGRLIKKYIEDNNLEYDIICGVPYGAFAVATVILG
jgi:orotate phosphoribosyltransferase